MAYIMIPNLTLHKNYGKYLLSFVDILVVIILEKIILLSIRKETNNKIKTNNKDSGSESESYFYHVNYIYLFNPITINICTRGSSDCLITFFVVLTIYLIKQKYILLSALTYGLAIHLKIYPVIYILTIFIYIATEDINLSNIITKDKIQNKKDNNTSIFNINYIYIFLLNTIKHYLKLLFGSCKAISFVIISIGIWVGFFAIFYFIYGNLFAFEYFLYHVQRKDHRHNYSLYFYLIYITYNSVISKILAFISFLPQALLILITSLKMFSNLEFCILIQTMIFVAFNKVITAQYFIWYISLLPLIAHKNELFSTKKVYGFILFIVWLFFELIWNYFSHSIEVLGNNKFYEINLINICFFIINCWIIKELIKYQKFDDVSEINNDNDEGNDVSKNKKIS